ncbi:hypothetical protein N7G274_006166 [Stereocaulon virgatum]|uniref:Uncharacterized protein n=1 Tax=Stereocaulon virgatum TaxID=373712 RepID=A0ABR4A8I5_9LECA
MQWLKNYQTGSEAGAAVAQMNATIWRRTLARESFNTKKSASGTLRNTGKRIATKDKDNQVGSDVLNTLRN